jgi:hypothetical protein
MKKAVCGVLLGALVFFVWGMVSWTLLPWHKATMKPLPEEQLIRDTLHVVVKQPGFYFFPSHQPKGQPMDSKLWLQKFQGGPVGVMAYKPAGGTPMDWTSFVISFLVALVAAGFSMMILILARAGLPSTSGRVLVVLGLGVFIWLVSDVPYWNWFFFPLDYTLVLLLDNILAFGLMGLVLAKFVPDDYHR